MRTNQALHTIVVPTMPGIINRSDTSKPDNALSYGTLWIMSQFDHEHFGDGIVLHPSQPLSTTLCNSSLEAMRVHLH